VGLADDAGGERQLIVVAGRRLVLHLDLGDDEEDAVALHVGIRKPDRAEQFDAAHLEILEEARVMEVAHRIALGVADAKGQDVLGEGHRHV
jgi:hypothetical protein